MLTDEHQSSGGKLQREKSSRDQLKTPSTGDRLAQTVVHKQTHVTYRNSEVIKQCIASSK